MARGVGRPAHSGCGVWIHPGPLAEQVGCIMDGRRRDDEESITTTGDQLLRLAREMMPLTAEQQRRLRRVAARAKPSQIARLLLSWDLNFSDRTIRRLSAWPVERMLWA